MYSNPYFDIAVVTMVLCESVNSEFVHFKCEILMKYLYSAAVC